MSKIPKAVRQQVWLDKFGEVYKSKCHVSWCNNIITAFEFHCGHDVPQSKGGTIDLTNLYPICTSCNLSMGDRYTIKEWDAMYKRPTPTKSPYFSNIIKGCFKPPLRKRNDVSRNKP